MRIKKYAVGDQFFSDTSRIVSFALVAVVVIASAVAPIAAGAHQKETSVQNGVSGERGDIVHDPENNSTAEEVNPAQLEKSPFELRDVGVQRQRIQQSLTTETTVIIELAPENRSVSQIVDSIRSAGGTIQLVHNRTVQVDINPKRVEKYRAIDGVESVRRPAPIVATGAAGEDWELDDDKVHEKGIKGDGVRIGVLDPEGFETSRVNNVVATKSYRGGIEEGNNHGSKVAQAAQDTAPNAEFLLANADTTEGMISATDWMVSKDVDVIVASFGYPQAPDDGSFSVTERLDKAAKNGVLVSVAAGNSRLGNWDGAWSDPDGDDVLNFDGSDETNDVELNAGTELIVGLTWQPYSATDQDYDLYLLDGSGNTVAKSTRTQNGDEKAYEVLEYTVPTSGTYSVVIKAASASGDHQLHLDVGNTNSLEYYDVEGSISSPAAGTEVTAVGYYAAGFGQISRYSAEGPTEDGRRGIDMIAPSGHDGYIGGTSGAAPRVAGTAALLQDADSSLSVDQLEQAMQNTAKDIGPDGVDTRAGYGLINSYRAVDSVADFSGGEPTFEVNSLQAPDSVDANTDFSVSATIQNTGGGAGSQSVDLLVDGGVRTSRDVSLASGGRKLLSWSVSGLSAGDHTVTVASQDGSQSQSLTVEETAPTNEPPKADAGDDQTTTEGKTVTLDASGSSDPDGDSLSYQWTQTSGPDVQLSGASSATPSFTAPSVSSETTLTFEVTVDDGKATATDTVNVTIQAENEPPQADAGDDQTTTEGKTVTLDASGSSDPDGDSLSYQWTQTGGPDVQLSGASSTTASFTAPSVSSETTLTFEVTVDDGKATATDSVQVTIQAENEPPKADAGSDQTTTEGKTVTLDASGSSDPDGDSLSYQWQQIDGATAPSVTLSDPTSPTPTFTAPSVLFEPTLTFEVTIDDGEATATDTVNVTIQAGNQPPQAEAGNDQTTTEGKTVTLDASGSSDPDSDSLSYQWTQTGGPDVQLSGASSTTASFTTPSVSSETTLTFEVTVDDGEATATDSVQITVQAGNEPPQADAGSDQTTTEGKTVTLDASESSDPSGDSLSYQWSQTGGPDVQLSGASSTTASFTTPSVSSETTLTFEVTVDDGQATDTDTVTVTVRPGNSPPNADAGTDQSVGKGAGVTLDATASSDPDGDSLTYQWQQIDGPTAPSVTLSDPTSPTPTFTAPSVPVETTLTFQVTVDDGEATATDSVQITVQAGNQPPQADAGSDQTTTEAKTVTLDASESSDPDGDSLSYQWQQIDGPTVPSVTLSDPTSPTPTFTAPSVPVETTLTFQVTVDDGEATATDSVQITVQAGNQPPQADAGDDQTTTEAKTVTLDASGSSDPDGDSLSYQWTQTGGPDIQLSGASSTTASFTTPSVSSETTLTFEVTVDDGEATATDTVQITVQAENEPPQAEAGNDQTIVEGESVTLDAGGSTDPDGDSLSYQWTQTGGPDVKLSGASSATPSFTAPSVSSETTLTFEVTVDDGQATTTDEVEVIVEPSDSSSDQVARRLNVSQVTPDGSVQVTMSYDVESPKDQATLIDSFEGPVSEVSIDAIQINGSRAPIENVLIRDSGVDAGVVAILEDISAGATVEVVYSVEIKEGASAGATVEFVGGDEGDVTAGEFTGDFGEDSVTIKDEIPARRSVSAEVPKGGSFTPTISVEVDEAQSRLSIVDDFSGPIESVSLSLTGLQINGSTAPASNRLLSRATASRGIVVVMQEIDAGSTVEVEYTMTISSNASVGDVVRFSGVDGAEVTSNSLEAELGTDVATVVEGGVIARFDTNGDGEISTDELQTAVDAWIEGSLATEGLQKIVEAWIDS